nr:serine-aspartate repeat-containing protein I [Misgurnus anguillicaudatus]
MRRGRKKGGNKDKVFGCDLQEHLQATAQEIPQVLRSCSEFIEEYGVVDGIYRLSGVSSNTQKLRNEFDTEGHPDLYKDVYLQDIHCVSSLCKAYFRELPNPLLTYELYDRFADAVAIQLEDERLVKIKEVLKDLPAPHYRTLEYLMRHLVKMSGFASQTNMHSRNLAIVWAPNLLRSKDIESTGFNGTAAFMEVRVQSIVVEFILTHVKELFFGSGLATERRKSLPSPSILSNQDEHFFKSLPLHCSGNLSPGDGPPLMRPYHAIIDGTDKRKGSLKGRKWKSIFNLGGRLQDPRKKNKYCPKEKETTPLRPAKSMDSLSSGPFAVEDARHPPARVLTSGHSDGGAPVGGGVSSGYAVTYRRTGGAQVSMVSSGTPGTYNRLDSAGGAAGSESSLQGVSRSPGMNSKADRRAGIHISGPFSVTVPLHITSGLALGVLHGGLSEKEQSAQGEADKEQLGAEEDAGMCQDVKGAESLSTDASKTDNDDVKENRGDMEGQGDCGRTTTQIVKEKDTLDEAGAPGAKEEVKADMNQDKKTTKENITPLLSQTSAEEEYMDMRGHLHQNQIISVDLTETDELSEQDVQEAFGFLDLMDSCASKMEFSVEPPCFEEEEEEVEDTNNQAVSSSVQESRDDISIPLFTHKPLPGKSHSLPYKSHPFMPALSLSSDDDYSLEEDDDDSDSDKGSEYEDMFCQSVPSNVHFYGLSVQTATCDIDDLSDNQSKCLDESHLILSQKGGEDLQSISQSEDTSLIVATSTDDSGTAGGASDQCFIDEHLSKDSKLEDLYVDNKNEESKSEDVKNDTHTMIGEDCLESSDSEEDTYFGPDPVPLSLEPIQAEMTNVSVHEPDQGQFPGVEVQEVLHTETYTAIEIIVTDSVTDDVTNSVNDDATDDVTDDATVGVTDDATVGVTDDATDGVTDDVTDEVTDVVTDDATDVVTDDATNDATDDVTDDATVGVTDDATDGVTDDVTEEVKDDVTDVVTNDVTDGVPDDVTDDITGEATATDSTSLAAQEEVKIDQPPEEENVIFHERKITEDEEGMKEPKEDETEDEEKSKGTEVVQETEECLNDIAETVEDVEDEVEGEEVEEQAQTHNEGDDMENTLEEIDIKTESDERNIKGTDEELDVNTDADFDEGNLPDEEITEEIAEGTSCRDDHEQTAAVPQPNEVSSEKSEEGEVDKQVNEESSIISDEELPQTAEHHPIPEKESEITAPNQASSQIQRSVPVVPPKPQNSKLTALTLRKQFKDRDTERQHRYSELMETDGQHDHKGQQQHNCVKQDESEEQHSEKEHRDQCSDRETEHSQQHRDTEQTDTGTVENGKKCLTDISQEDGKKALRESLGTGDAGTDFRKDLHREGEREVKRNSGISICFDEAVARATVKRNKDRESSDRLSGAQWERDSRKEREKQREKDEEAKTD